MSCRLEMSRCSIPSRDFWNAFLLFGRERFCGVSGLWGDMSVRSAPAVARRFGSSGPVDLVGNSRVQFYACSKTRKARVSSFESSRRCAPRWQVRRAIGSSGIKCEFRPKSLRLSMYLCTMKFLSVCWRCRSSQAVRSRVVFVEMSLPVEGLQYYGYLWIASMLFLIRASGVRL